MITIVVALGTLAFTGVSTFFQANVSLSQLEQAKEAAAQAERAQASRVTFWVDDAEDVSPQLHVKNSSADPVYNLSIIFLFGVTKGVTLYFGKDAESLPPCSEMVIDKGMLRYSKPHKNEAITSKGYLSGLDVLFQDENGEWWDRTDTKLQHTNPHAPHGVAENVAPGEVAGNPKVKRASPCG